MRFVGLFAVLALVFVLVASSLNPAAAISGITIKKLTTNGDTTTVFHFTASGPFISGPVTYDFDLHGGSARGYFGLGPAEYTILETVPGGWALTVTCEGNPVNPVLSTFNYIPGGVTITYATGDFVVCVFTNSPVSVGGVLMPANTFVLLSPWLAVIGLVGCIGTVVAVAKKRHP
jgi:hypothetical protein